MELERVFRFLVYVVASNTSNFGYFFLRRMSCLKEPKIGILFIWRFLKFFESSKKV